MIKKQKQLFNKLAYSGTDWAKVLGVIKNTFSNIRVGNTKIKKSYLLKIKEELEKQMDLVDELLEDNWDY